MRTISILNFFILLDHHLNVNTNLCYKRNERSLIAHIHTDTETGMRNNVPPAANNKAVTVVCARCDKISRPYITASADII